MNRTARDRAGDHPAPVQRIELNEDKLDNKAKAVECYEKLLLDYPNSLYADNARKRYNALKTR